MPNSPPSYTAADFLAALRQPAQPGSPQEVCVDRTGQPAIADGVSLAKHSFGRPVRVVGAVFEGFVDLAEALFEKALRFEGCTFKGGLRLRDVRVGGLFSLAGCTIVGKHQGFVDARRLRVDGVCDLSLVTADVGLDFTNLIAKDDLRLDGIKLTATVKEAKDIPAGLDPADRQHFEDEMLGKALNLGGAEIAKHVYVYAPVVNDGTKRGAEVTGEFNLRAKVGGSVAFVGATLTNPGGLAVDMEAADVGGSVFFNDGTKVEGQIDLRAKVGGQVIFSAATLTNPGGTAVNMWAADVGGSAFFRERTTVTGQIDLRAKVGGNVEFLTATLTNSGGLAVDMVAADVGESVFFREGTTVTGQIDLRAKVGGNVEFLTATLTNPGGKAVDMNRADVGGSVFFDEGTIVEGTVEARQAKLRNGLFTSRNVNQRTFSLPKSGTPKNLTLLGKLDLSYAEISGPALFHLVDVWGEIDARHLTVHGDLDFCGSVIGPSVGSDAIAARRKPDKDGKLTPEQKMLAKVWHNEEIERLPSASNTSPLNFEMAEVHGRFWAKGSKFLGTVTLEDAEIAGEANFDGAEVHGDLKLRSATVRGRVFADERTTAAYPLVSGHVDLSYATLAQVDMRFDKTSNDLTPDTINLTGATVGTLRLHGMPEREEKGKLIRPWLLTEGLKFQQLELDGLEGGSRPPPSKRDYLRQGIWCSLLIVAFCLACCHSALLALVVVAYAVFVVVTRFKDRGVPLREVWERGQLRPAATLLTATNGIRGGWAKVCNFASAGCSHAVALFQHTQPLCGVPSSVLGLLGMTYPFSRGFYLLVEQWLRNAGDDVTANEVFHMRRRRESGEAQPRPGLVPPTLPRETWPAPNIGLRMWYRFVDFAAGFGLRTNRLLNLYALLFMLNIGVFLNPQSVERPLAFTQSATTRRAAMRDEAFDRQAVKDGHEKELEAASHYWSADGGTPLPDEWGFVNAFFMASRVQVPFLAMVAENDWEPSSRPFIGPMTHEEYAGLMMFINLILLPLMLAGLTGFLKK